ncbi:MAG: oligosaccharide flippase family protein [Flavobacteriia bacterium]
MPIKFLREFSKSHVFKSFVMMFSGTLLAQAIGYAIAPILTRLYSTAEMGEMMFYLRLTAFLSSIITLRYEAALPLPKKDDHSYLIYRFIYYFSMWVLLFLGILFAVFSVTDLFPKLNAWFYLFTILGTAAMILINVGTSWAVRKGQYGIITRQKITNSLFANGFKWGFYYLHWSKFGLILATMLGFVLSAFEFLFDFRRTHHSFKSVFSKPKTAALLKEHGDFPKLNLPHVLVDNGKEILLATLILAYFGESIYGSYGHSYQMLRIPLMLVGVSIGQLFYNRTSEAMHKKKPLVPIITKTIGMLTLISLVPFTILFFLGADIFAFVFGPHWRASGTFSQIMALWLMVNFILSPITALPLLLNRQKDALLMGMVSAILQLVPFWVFPFFWGNDSTVFIEALKFVSYSQALWLLLTILRYGYFAMKSDALLTKP